MQKMIPSKSNGNDKTYEKKLIYLDEKTSLSPSVAVLNANLEICRMWRIANENLNMAMNSFINLDMDMAKKVHKNEEIIDYLSHNITTKLVWINNMVLSEYEAAKIGVMFKAVTDIERIGDHAENIAEFAIIVEEKSLKFSDTAIKELTTLGELTLNLAVKALDVYEKEDVGMLQEINLMEQEIDKLSAEFTENHINRLKIASCEPKSGVIFTDMITDLERVADHAYNISFTLSPHERKA